MKTAEAIEQIVYGNPFLQFGLTHRLYNLSEMAQFIRPVIEVRLEKSIRKTALVMALSRLQKALQRELPSGDGFEISNLGVQSHLATYSYDKSRKTHEQVNLAYNAISRQREYFVYSESTSEITIFFHKKFVPVIQNIVNEPPKYKNDDITAVQVKFDEQFFHEPGMLYLIMQKMMLQNINIVEISSTFTEFTFFINSQDLPLVFDTLRACFEVSELK